MEKPYAIMNEYELAAERDWLEWQMNRSENEEEIERLYDKICEIDYILESSYDIDEF